MTDPTPTPTPSPTPPPTPPPTPTPAAWHAGIDAEILGHWQNKGWKVDDPKEVALAATRQAREAEKFFGVPADQILKMPKPDAKPEDIKAFWSKLGAPAEAKDYDFSAVKDAAGNPIGAPLADAIRNAAAAAHLPKDAATTIAQAVAKQLDDAKASEATITAAKMAEEKATLAKNWGDKAEFNKMKAMEGAQRLGKPFVEALEKAGVGYADIMEAMRKIGAGTSEDTFIDRGARGGPGNPVTREGAVARKAELMNDSAWAKRYLGGGAAEKMEMDGLNIMIDGESRAA